MINHLDLLADVLTINVFFQSNSHISYPIVLQVALGLRDSKLSVKIKSIKTLAHKKMTLYGRDFIFSYQMFSVCFMSTLLLYESARSSSAIP